MNIAGQFPVFCTGMSTTLNEDNYIPCLKEQNYKKMGKAPNLWIKINES